MTAVSEPAIESLLGHLVPEDGPGVAVGVSLHGVLVASAVRGLACVEHGIPVTVRTRFPLASVARQLTASGAVVHDTVGLVVPGMAFGYRGDGAGGYLRCEMTDETLGDGGVLASVEDLAGWHGSLAAERAVVDGREVLVRTGAHDGFCSFLAWVPGSRLGVTVLSNSTGTDVGSVGREAVRCGLGRDPER